MNKLRTLQQLVGGDMQAVYPWSKDDVALICNDSGKVDGLPLNRSLEDYDIIAGNFFICGFSGEKFCSLTDKQLRHYEKLFRDPELFLPTPIGIMGIALSIEHGQGYSCRSHILAASALLSCQQIPRRFWLRDLYLCRSDSSSWWGCY